MGLNEHFTPRSPNTVQGREAETAATGAPLGEALRKPSPIPKGRVSFLRLDADDWTNAVFRQSVNATASFWGVEPAMPYSITLRSRIDATITGWYDGSRSRWSTDHKRRRLFHNKHEAKSIREELRSLCPRNVKVINVEPEQVDDNGARIWKGFTGFDWP
jgi:hypothetical protein